MAISVEMICRHAPIRIGDYKRGVARITSAINDCSILAKEIDFSQRIVSKKPIKVSPALLFNRIPVWPFIGLQHELQ